MDLRERVEEVLQEIREGLREREGTIDLLEVDERDGVVKVRVRGACVSCPASQMTSYGLVEGALREKVPQIREVQIL
jgi:Fe-S cluster biogenesis protein NfuA